MNCEDHIEGRVIVEGEGEVFLTVQQVALSQSVT